VSAGNSGAAMIAAKLIIGTIAGVERPALAALVPGIEKQTLVVDVGANVDCKPHNLEQFAVMGDIYSRTIFGIRRPKVGLLSVGEEESKGNDLTRAAYQLLKRLPLNFVGNVEGRDLYNGKLDVIVCDGFVGNVALKVSEGMVETVRYMLKETLTSTISSQLGFLLSRRAFKDFKKRLDYSEYGGAPLLGIKGVCIVGHGSSNSNAIKNALRVASDFANAGINAKIEHELAVINGKVKAAVTT
jgi:glycerol-3-phosphate acyltransferase PlsX